MPVLRVHAAARLQDRRSAGRRDELLLGGPEENGLLESEVHPEIHGGEKQMIRMPRGLFYIWAIVSFAFLFGGWAAINSRIVSLRWRETLFVFGIVCAGTFLSYMAMGKHKP